MCSCTSHFLTFMFCVTLHFLVSLLKHTASLTLSSVGSCRESISNTGWTSETSWGSWCMKTLSRLTYGEKENVLLFPNLASAFNVLFVVAVICMRTTWDSLVDVNQPALTHPTNDVENLEGQMDKWRRGLLIPHNLHHHVQHPFWRKLVRVNEWTAFNLS